MKLEKALELLGLNDNYDRDELDKRYSTLTEEYIESRRKNSEENINIKNKIKEIKSARRYLKRKLEEKFRDEVLDAEYTPVSSINDTNLSSIDNRMYFDDTTLKVFKIKITNQTNEEIKLLYNIIVKDNQLLIDTKNKILNIYKTKIEYIEKTNNTNDLLYMSSSLDSRVISLLKVYAMKFCKKAGIYTDYEKLDYTSLYNLSLQLNKLEENVIRMDRILENELYKYTVHQNFNQLSGMFDKIKKEVLRIMQINSVTIENGVSYFNGRIVSEFRIYYKRLREVDRIKKMYNGINDRRLKGLLVLLERSANDTDKYSETMNILNNYVKGNIKIRLYLYRKNIINNMIIDANNRKTTKQIKSNVRKKVKTC